MSIASQHTPGDWEVTSDYGANKTEIASSSGQAIAAVWTKRPVHAADPRPVYEPWAEGEANAKLIAASPDLLEALVELTALMQATYEGEYTPDSFTTQPALRAIAKAVSQ